jgi:hypothetical protein
MKMEFTSPAAKCFENISHANNLGKSRNSLSTFKALDLKNEFVL